MSLKHACSGAAVSVMLAFAPAAMAEPLSGAFSGKVDKQTVHLRGGFDRVDVQQTASGVNRSPGAAFDGAKVTWSERVTLDKGSGPVQGIVTFTTPAGTETSAYRGMVSTDAQQRVTANGTFRSISHTGALSKGRSHGVFSIAYTSKTEFQGQWKVTGGASAKVSSR